MLDQLKQLLEMQKALDKDILEKHGIKEYPLENMKIALFVELGELMNELPTKFKHWKSSAIDNREKALVEYVDCLHFCLSLTNHFNNKVYSLDMFGYEQLYDPSSYTYFDLLSGVVEEFDEWKLPRLFALGNKIGFTWEEIYNAYIEKNKVNYERLKNGY